MATNVAEVHRAVNKWGARVVPIILIGIVGYCTWVVIALLSVNHLLKPRSDVQPRHGAGIAIIVIYFILFVSMTLSYFRLVQVIFTNPGYVPLPQNRRGSDNQHGSSSEKPPQFEGNNLTPSAQAGFLDRMAISGGRLAPPPGLEDFYKRDAFECEMDGLPRWCSTCKHYKPDRSHHSTEVGRCVYKMDHFCPWAGGMVSETSFKFFVQFCLCAMFFCLFILVVMAYFTSELHNMGDFYNVNYIVVIVLSALFFLFSGGMTFTSLHSVLYNTTTVDQLARSSRVYHYAVLMPQETNPNRSYSFSTITYPFRMGSSSSNEAVVNGGRSEPQPRTFAILATPRGTNPYDLPSRLDNFKTVMGDYFIDWLFPIRPSPCTRHGAEDGRGSNERGIPPYPMYKLGPVVLKMISDAGLVPPSTMGDGDRAGRQSRLHNSEAMRQLPRTSAGGPS